jgi:hypothetical protein
MQLLPLTNSREFVLVDDRDAPRFDGWPMWLESGVISYPAISRRDGKRHSTRVHTVILGKTARGYVVDHINGDTLDNRRSNLRVVTQSRNMIDRHLRYRRNTSGIRGVWFRRDTGRWAAELVLRYKKINLGCFATREEAAAARERGERKYYGSLCPIPKERKELR